MNDALSTAEIKSRSISGAKWLVVMNALGMPAAFLIALMLGRVGPEALGSYALAQILVGVITTFVIYGGPPVLSVFIPKIAGAENRGRFVFSYLMILVAGTGAALSLFWLFPGVLEFLLQRDFDMRHYRWFVLLALTIVAAEAFANAASGLMLIKTTAIARQMMRLVLLPLVAVLFFARRDLLADYGMSVIFGGFLAGYLAAAVISLIGISRDTRFSLRPGWLLPSGFWAFSSVTMASTVFTFLYANFDRMAVLAIQDVSGLGIYQAVLSINMLLAHIPTLLLPSLTPTFSNLLAGGHEAAFKRAFALLCRWAVVPIAPASMAVMSYSTEILGLFGAAYVDYAFLLTLFALVAILRSAALPSQIILTCKEQNVFRFMQQGLIILGQGTLTVLFMSHYGVIAIAGAKLISAALASFVGIVYVVFRLGMAPALPLAYKVAVAVGVTMAMLRILIIPVGWLPATLLALSGIALFLAFSRYSLAELRGLARLVVRGNAEAFGDPRNNDWRTRGYYE